jgi:hypothetical protein
MQINYKKEATSAVIDALSGIAANKAAREL